MENFETSYACSPIVLGTPVGAHSTGLEGTGLSIAMRDKSTIAATAIASLPTSDVVVFGDNAGIRTWSPPV